MLRNYVDKWKGGRLVLSEQSTVIFQIKSCSVDVKKKKLLFSTLGFHYHTVALFNEEKTHQTCCYVVITLKSDFLSSLGISDDVVGHKVVISAQKVRRTSSTLLFEYITYCAVS